MSKKNYKKQADEIRTSLDDILNDDTVSANIDTPQLPARKSELPVFNYVTKRNDAAEKAKKTIGSLLKFYLSEEIIDKDEYVKAKMRIEEMTLGALIFQMETAERAITTLLQQIDDGDVSPRMFEVLGTLQKSMLDIIKSQTMYILATEESVKKLARDIDVYSVKRNKSEDRIKKVEPQGNINRGTKGLMMQIQDELTEKNIEDAIEPETIEPDLDDFPSAEEYDDQ